MDYSRQITAVAVLLLGASATACGDAAAPPGETRKSSLDPTKAVPPMSREVTYALEHEEFFQTAGLDNNYGPLSVALVLSDGQPRSFRAHCVDANNFIDDRFVHHGWLYSSYERLPEAAGLDQVEHLDALNYLMNAHAEGSVFAASTSVPSFEVTDWHLQSAAWMLVSTGQPAPVPTQLDLEVSALVTDAREYGEGFVPGPGAIGLMILVSDTRFEPEAKAAQTLALNMVVPGYWDGYGVTDSNPPVPEPSPP